jgi:predicted nucleic acid-binding protein
MPNFTLPDNYTIIEQAERRDAVRLRTTMEQVHLLVSVPVLPQCCQVLSLNEGAKTCDVAKVIITIHLYLQAEASSDNTKTPNRHQRL